MNRQLKRSLLLVLLAGLSVSAACRLYNIERSLDPVNADFLSKVRYIISSQERKIFLELPDSEKPQFIEDFWKRRDPDPSTEENEFKIEYFSRIEKATQLFVGEGIAGWLTDRGRIYIHFGPPTDRLMESSGDVYSRCQEIWYYGNFPIVFYDETCTGTYKLMTYDFTMLRDIDLTNMNEQNMAQFAAQKASGENKKTYDFNAGLSISVREAGRIEAVVVLEVPYERIWYKSEGKTLFTTLKVSLELRDARKNLIWEHKSSHDIRLDEAELEAKSGKPYKIEIPIVIQDEEKISLLGRDKDVLFITLVNTTGDESLKKAIDFK